MGYIGMLIFVFVITLVILSAFQMMAAGGGNPNHKDHNRPPWLMW